MPLRWRLVGRCTRSTMRCSSTLVSNAGSRGQNATVSLTQRTRRGLLQHATELKRDAKNSSDTAASICIPCQDGLATVPPPFGVSHNLSLEGIDRFAAQHANLKFEDTPRLSSQDGAGIDDEEPSRIGQKRPRYRAVAFPPTFG